MRTGSAASALVGAPHRSAAPAIGSGLMVTAVATVYLSEARGDGAIVRAMRCRALDESNEAARVAGSGAQG